jgi:ribose 5-phosphate isomerase B
MQDDAWGLQEVGIITKFGLPATGHCQEANWGPFIAACSMSKLSVALASDHAGFRYKEEIKRLLLAQGYTVRDFGTHTAESCDYPAFIRPAAEAVARGEYDRGIVLGGSGNGEAIVANKVRGIRCGLCWSIETAVANRDHNDGNVLALGERMISQELALQIVQVWLETPFSNDPRHLRRIAAIESTPVS